MTLYEAAGGADGMLALAHAWHERCLADTVAAHPFSHGVHAQHRERLAAYWGEALGGPAECSASMGDETGVLGLHAGNGEHPDLDERAVACFDAALGDVGYTGKLREVLHDYFAWSTIRMAAHPDAPDTLPVGVPLPRWSWAGVVSD